jgi:hypothetical protein
MHGKHRKKRNTYRALMGKTQKKETTHKVYTLIVGTILKPVLTAFIWFKTGTSERLLRT